MIDYEKIKQRPPEEVMGELFEDDEDKSITPFEQPIAGQSLTEEPGKYPYEQPPEMTDPEQALDFLLESITQRSTTFRLLHMMDSGVPVKMIVEFILTEGASNGKWSFPMMYVMAPGLSAVLVKMAEAAGIKARLTGREDMKEETPAYMVQDSFKKLKSGVDAAVDVALEDGDDIMEEAMDEAPAGLMGA